jgi:hypothetical protein
MESKDTDPFYITLGIGHHPPADLNRLKEQGDKDINDLKCKVESDIGNLQNSETQKYFGDLIGDFKRVFNRHLFAYLQDEKIVFVIFAGTRGCKGVHGYELVMEQVMKGDRNGRLYSPQTIFVSLSDAFKLQPTGAHVNHMIGLKMICIGDQRYAVSP